MTKHFWKTAALSSALLLGTAGISAYSLDVTTPGNGVSVTTGNTGGANGGTVTIDQDNGPLADVDSNGNPIGEGSWTNGDVNLGSLLAGIDLSDVDLGNGNDGANGGTGANGGSGSGGGYALIASSLSSGDRQKLKIRCRNILEDPTKFKSDVVKFCRVIFKL